MTREEAIEELKEDIALYMPTEWVEEIDRDTPDGQLITALEMAIKALEQNDFDAYWNSLWKSAYEKGKADAEQRWIPVGERLPEERDWYLAVFKESDTGFQLIPRVADYIGRGENKWRLMDESGLSSEYRDLLECIAWMPLPEPYNAESEDKE